jgi:hypothetical protein
MWFSFAHFGLFFKNQILNILKALWKHFLLLSKGIEYHNDSLLAHLEIGNRCLLKNELYFIKVQPMLLIRWF